MTRPVFVVSAPRVLVAGLVGAIAGIHLELWAGYGYRHIPTIGTLFLLNGIGGALLGLSALAPPRRLLPLAWIAAALFAGATLIALIISLNTTLFGFTETTAAPLLIPSIVLEAATVLTGGLATFQYLKGSRKAADHCSTT